MITKEQREELRRQVKAGCMSDSGVTLPPSPEYPGVPVVVGPSDGILELLDALDRAEGTRDALADQCNRVADALGIRDDESAVEAIEFLKRKIGELRQERGQ